jgi:predicted PurR-regulated permease PerM
MAQDRQAAREATHFYRRVFALATIALLGYALVLVLKPFLAAIAWAALIAFLLHPVHERLTRTLRGRTSLSSGLLTFGTLLVAIGPLAALGVAFARQTAYLLEKLQASVGPMSRMSVSTVQNIPVVGRALSWLDERLPFSADQLQGWAVDAARNVLQYLASLGGTLFVGAIGTVVGFAIVLFLLFFFIRDGATMHERLVRLLPMPVERKQRLVTFVGAVTRAVVFGTLLTAALQGTLLGIGLAIAGIPSPVVLGVIGAVVALLPVGGTALVWIPAAIALAMQGHYGSAIFLSLWGALLVGLVDNFLKPMVISGRAEVPTLAAFIGVIGGLAAFGAVGMFLGPVLLAVTLALLKFAEEPAAHA